MTAAHHSGMPVTLVPNIADRQATSTLRLLEGKKLIGKITQSGNYVHSHSMDATAYDDEGEELAIEVSDRFRDLMRDFADWIYKGLEADYDYRTSDEAANDCLSEGDYEFDEEGEMQ
jgi:hypothetical protein